MKIGNKEDDLPAGASFDGYDANLLCDPGVYPATVLACQDHQSSNGNDCFKTAVGVDSPQGGVLCWHYAVKGQQSLTNWLKAFGFDLEKLEDDAEIDAAVFNGKSFNARVSVEEDANGKYAPKMKIQSVYPADKATPSGAAPVKKAAPKKQPARAAAAKPNEVQGDDAPF